MRGEMSSVLTDKTRPPDDDALLAALGAAATHWRAILERAEAAAPDARREWKHYGAKHGWQLKLMLKKRALLWLIPHRGSFMAATALGPAAVAGLRAAGITDALATEIENGRDLPEGKAARVEVATRKDAATVLQLVALKVDSLRTR